VRDETFNRMCVADLHSSCHEFRMTWFIRPFLALFLALSLFGATVTEVSAGLAAEIAAAADPCCEGDCPDDTACGAACEMMMRGGVPVFSQPQAQAIMLVAPETIATLLMTDRHHPSGLAPDGIRRPPRI
jgi:hypothetical protein